MAIRKPFFVVPLDLGTITVTPGATAGFPITNLNRQEAIGLIWKSVSANGAPLITGDFGSAQAVDFAAMIAVNDPAAQYRLRLGTSQAAVQGGAASYDSSYSGIATPTISRTDGLYHSHFELPSTQTFRYWSFEVTGIGVANIQAANLVLGRKVEPSHFYNTDFSYGVRDLGDLTFSRWGVADIEPGAIFRELSFTLGWQTEAEFEASFRPMIEKLGKRGIVYCCFDPEPTTYRQARTYLGVFDKPPFARGIRKPRTFTQDFSLVSLI